MAVIKVVSYNIKNGQGMDGRVDLSRTADVLQALDADIICLQEIDKYRRRSFFCNQAAKLARIMQMEYVFGSAIRYIIGAYGNALLSRYPVIKSVNHQLPVPTGRSKRAMLEMHCTIGGKKLRVFNTHMELDRKLRLKQIENFIVPLILSTDSAAILCGDLNETPDDAGVKFLYDCFKDSFVANTGSVTATFRADQPVERMDYILLNPACRAVDYKIIPSLASDHLPVMAWVELVS